MTVGEWIARRLPAPPAALTARVLAALGSDSQAPESATAETCLAAAARELDGLVADTRFGRDSALDLLAIDALTTYAFEYASATGDAVGLNSLVEQSAHRLAQIAGNHA